MVESTARLNRRAKLVAEAEAAGDRVIEAAQAWVAAVPAGYLLTEQEFALAVAVRGLNARVAKAERASC